MIEGLKTQVKRGFLYLESFRLTDATSGPTNVYLDSRRDSEWIGATGEPVDVLHRDCGTCESQLSSCSFRLMQMCSESNEEALQGRKS